MGNTTQVNQERVTGTGQSRNMNHYGHSNTTSKPILKINITEIEDAVFTQGFPSDAKKHKDLIETLINYVQQEYSAVVYLRQSIQEGKAKDSTLPIKPTKDNNQ